MCIRDRAGNPIPQLGLGGNFLGTDQTLLAKLDQVVTDLGSVSYTHLRAHETVLDIVCRLLLHKKTTPPPPHPPHNQI